MKPFDAFLLTYQSAKHAVKAKANLTVSEWADANRVLSGEGSAEKGRWKTSRTPYLREIMDSLSEDSPDKLIAFMKSSQVGGTECGSNWIGYIMDHAKGPAAIVMPTERSLNDWVSQKFDPMANDTPAVADVLAKKSNRTSDNNAQRKKFTGGILYFKTAGSTAELKSTSLRYAMADELDEWDWTTTQGDPLGLLEVRLTTFFDRKLFAPSTPTMKDASRIEELFDNGDQRHYQVPCPHCGEYQHLKWPNVRWNKNVANQKRLDSVHYYCEASGCIIDEHHKTEMMAKGRWVAEAPQNAYKSYHINALYSPIGLGLSWLELAYEWIEAQGDPAKLMRFINTRLGETFADRSHDLKPNVLVARAEPYQLRTIPIGVLVLTAGVDTQDDRFEIQITGHGRNDVTMPIDYHVIYGKPDDEKTRKALVDYLVAAKFTNHFGREMKIEATAIDTGGHHTHTIYQFVREAARYGLHRVMACKGASTYGRAILGKPSLQDVNTKGQVIKKGVALYMIGADTAKHLLYARLNGDSDKDPSERKVRFSTELPPEYFDGLVSEVYNPRKNQWELKKGKRNEQLDTWILSIAASHHPEIYLHKWKKSDWERRAAMIEPNQAPKEAIPEVESDEIESFVEVKAPQVAKPRNAGFVKGWKKT
ncbi:MAG: phage terminase large subunit family protein [Methylotenera sp.]